MTLGAVVGGGAVLGAVACFAVAAIGLVRLPDTLERLQAATVADVPGIALVCAALALTARSTPETLRLLLLAILVVATNVVTSHLLARRAARRAARGEEP